jgi:hypothetical protein
LEEFKFNNVIACENADIKKVMTKQGKVNGTTTQTSNPFMYFREVPVYR